jgi:hypothetical protein
MAEQDSSSTLLYQNRQIEAVICPMHYGTLDAKSYGKKHAPKHRAMQSQTHRISGRNKGINICSTLTQLGIDSLYLRENSSATSESLTAKYTGISPLSLPGRVACTIFLLLPATVDRSAGRIW